MSPQLAAKLMSDVPEMQEFVSYIRREITKLNTISDMNFPQSDAAIATEVMARRRASEKLAIILAPLLELQSTNHSNPLDFVA